VGWGEREMFAFLTAWPSAVEFRTEDGRRGSEPRERLGELMESLLEMGVEQIQVRVEGADD
jgi:hypothetical protein